MTVPYVAKDADHQSLEWLSGHPVKVLLNSAAKGGQLMMLESTPHAGSASPLHVHGREDEMFLLLAGAVVVVVGEQRYELGKGGVAFLPRDVLHASLLEPATGWRAGGQRYFELSKPLLSLSLLSSARPAQSMREPHDESWAADVRATGRAPGPSLAQAPILGS